MTMWEGERKARAALTFVCEAGNPALSRTVSEQGAEAVFAALKESNEEGAWPKRARAIDSDALTATADRLGLRFLIPGDDEWPAPLEDLAVISPFNGMGGIPHGLWVKGPGHLAEQVCDALAIVGARACTRYGESVAADLAAELADHVHGKPWTIISGGAYGIDAAAHRGALASGGRTIGIYAGGLDQGYPRGNASLFETLMKHHLIVSEIPPGLRPTRAGFLTRNRLIAALSRGTVIVEAAARSGARNTAHWAAELGRFVMAVPGSVHSSLSVTPHRLIRDAEAVLVASSNDVRMVVNVVGAGPEPHVGGESRALDALTPAQRIAREALPARGSLSASEVSLLSGLRLGDALAALSELEMMGLATGSDDGQWRLCWPKKT